MNIFGYEIIIRRKPGVVVPPLPPVHEVWVVGDLPANERTIADMRPGDVGYTVPWAWDERVGQLRTSFTIGHKGGTSSLRVECVGQNQYRIEFTRPVYHQPFIEMNE